MPENSKHCALWLLGFFKHPIQTDTSPLTEGLFVAGKQTYQDLSILFSNYIKLLLYQIIVDIKNSRFY